MCGALCGVAVLLCTRCNLLGGAAKKVWGGRAGFPFCEVGVSWLVSEREFGFLLGKDSVLSLMLMFSPGALRE